MMIKYGTFICYRGRQCDNGTSIDIASKLFDCIKKEKKAFGEVFFAEDYSRTSSYDFMKDAEPFIKGVDRFIVVLCNSFFKDFYITDKDGNVTANKESSTYIEIKAALKYGRNIFPVYSQEFNWDSLEQNGTMDCLRQIFSEEELGRIRHRSGALRWRSVNEPDEKEIIDALSKDYTRIINSEINIEELRHQLWTIHKYVSKRKQTLKENDLETDYRAYSSLKKKNKELFYLPSGYIYGVRSLQRSDDSFRGQGYNVIKKLCCLPKNNNLYYWSIDCKSAVHKKAEISVCAICFGMLIRLGLLTEDRILLKNKELVSLGINNVIECLEGAMNLLIMLRDYYSYSWMSCWSFDDHAVYGTINQTTLSLSTLLKCDFLSSKLEDAILLNRYRFFDGSIEWLLSKTVLDGNGSRYWRQISTEGGEKCEYSLTCFGFDVLVKYYGALLRIKNARVGSDDQSTRNLLGIIDLRMSDICKYICQILNQFRDWIESWCYYQRYNGLVSDQARVLSSLCGFYHLIDVTKDPDLLIFEETLKNSINNLLDLLLTVEPTYFDDLTSKEENKLSFREEYFEEYYLFSMDDLSKEPNDKESFIGDENGNAPEKEDYENCSETLLMIALMNAARCDYVSEGKKAKIKQSVDSILKSFSSRIKENIHQNFTLIRSRREDGLDYPLYHLYHYRNMLKLYLTLYDKETER